MYNKVICVGNLTRNIELKYTPSGLAIGKSSIATSHKYKTATGDTKEEVCFLEFNIMGKMAETANQYLKKGSKAMLEGRLVLEQWTDSTGQARSKHSLRVETMKMLDSKVATNNTQENQPHQTNYAIQQTQAQQLQQNVNQASQMQGSLIDENDEMPF
jgi:single-strand DNA-binding protein